MGNSSQCKLICTYAFLQVANRRVRSVDGDIPCDGKGLPRIYKSGCIYVRLNDESMWVGN